jgi:hypothetical protein
MSKIACGAAIECAVCAADDHGWTVEVVFADNSIEQNTYLARIYLREFEPEKVSDRLQKLMAARITNRRPYDRQPLAVDGLAALQHASTPSDETTVHWIAERPQIEAFARLIARADSMLFSEPSMRAAFFKNVRFDLPAQAAADKGLSMGALEASAFERTALRLMRYEPQWMFKLTAASHIFSQHAVSLVNSASGLCIVSVQGAERPQLRAGRAMLRAWLALTEQGMAVQPMMSSVAMTQALECGSPELIKALGVEKLRAFVAEFRASLAALGIRGSPQFLMRFGRAADPSCRTGRLPLSELIRKND